MTPLSADYCASKFAAVGFAESVALELLATGKDGVKTTIVCPYFINTGMFDGCQTKYGSLHNFHFIYFIEFHLAGTAGFRIICACKKFTRESLSS